MRISNVLATFKRSPLIGVIKKSKVEGLEVIAMSGDDLTECATWGEACSILPAHLSRLRASCLAGMCTVRSWGEAHVVVWADGNHAWICEVAR